MKFQDKRKIVITGGPCSGKTSLIRELAGLEYTVVEEAATQIISEGEYHPQKDPLTFQRQVVARQISLEKSAERKTDGLIFCDRGIYDGLAYLRFFDVSESELNLPEEWNYLMVFHLAQLRYEKDQIRFESPEEASEISSLLRHVYVEKEVPLETVPVMNVVQRAKFVLQKVEDKQEEWKNGRMEENTRNKKGGVEDKCSEGEVNTCNAILGGSFYLAKRTLVGVCEAKGDNTKHAL